MATDRLEREEALITIAQLRQQQQQQQQAEQQSHLPNQDAAQQAQHTAELERQVAELASSNDELSTDLGRALDVAQRVIDQKSKLQEQCQSQEQQLLQWQAEAHRVKELEGRAPTLAVSCVLSLQLLCCAVLLPLGHMVPALLSHFSHIGKLQSSLVVVLSDL